MDIEKTIGKRIQQLRKRAGLTQEDFSEMLEITPHYLSALERGIYNIKLETLVKMLNLLNCSADEAFSDVVNKSSDIKSCVLSEKLSGLSADEQGKILNVVDTMIKNATK